MTGELDDDDPGLYLVTHLSAVIAGSPEEALELALAQALSDRACFVAVDVRKITDPADL